MVPDASGADLLPAHWPSGLCPAGLLGERHSLSWGTQTSALVVHDAESDQSNLVLADIGGILPGSMPPHSKELYQEGAAIKGEKLVSEGKFNEERITELLYNEPAQYPGCSGTRCLADNLNDLKAQIAANKKGIGLIGALIEEYGEDVVLFYMRQIQDNAELSVRNLLKEVSRRFSGRDLSAIDYMDDGTPIELKITIDAEQGEAVFDFNGTGPEVYGENGIFLAWMPANETR